MGENVVTSFKPSQLSSTISFLTDSRSKKAKPFKFNGRVRTLITTATLLETVKLETQARGKAALIDTVLFKCTTGNTTLSCQVGITPFSKTPTGYGHRMLISLPAILMMTG